MSSSNPEWRLRNLHRRVRDLLMGHRLSADPERTGIVELSDFGKAADELADFAAQSVKDMEGVRGPEGECGRRIAETVELAARAAARFEELPKTPKRVGQQCAFLEEAERDLDAALRAECRLEEPPGLVSLSQLARRERDLFAPLVTFEGGIEDSPPGMVAHRRIRRALRRAIVGHAGGPFRLEVSRDGTLTFDVPTPVEVAGKVITDAQEVPVLRQQIAFRVEQPVTSGVPRSPLEPPEVKRALDLRETAPDVALKDFLLVKAVDEALFAFLEPRMRSHEIEEKARALPRRPGKRAVVRPEGVARAAAGWDVQEAARIAERAADRRAGPEFVRVPKGAYLLRLFYSEDDTLAADLLSLGPALRKMEKGEAVEGTGPAAERALLGLLGLLA
ncbi:MAG TPA: hypothetical protein VFY93_12605 [Planctomycetota bacterium]|nr:hypothetical protein [Planctomycetota bacterium]